MIQPIAFLTYAVSDIKVARHFYEEILGLNLTHEAGGEWFEYDVGDTTFAISVADADYPVPVRGAVVAFEVSELDAEVARLRKLGVTFRREITETPVCASPLSSTRTAARLSFTSAKTEMERWPNQCAANRRPTGQSDGSDNLLATVAADRMFSGGGLGRRPRT